MRLRFGELSAQELRIKERLQAGARDAWRLLRTGDDTAAGRAMDRLDSRVSLTVRRDASDRIVCAELTAFEPSAWPVAELLLAEAPVELDCALSLGRAALPLEEALAEVRASHAVELQRASVRAGFGRGHLLEITLGVPGGLGSDNEQIAAENLVRGLLGDRLFETWIGAVHVTPAPRGGSLRVLDPNAPRTTLELRDLFDTVAAAVRGVLQGLPTEAHAQQRAGAPPAKSVSLDDDAHGDWTLLEIEPLADAPGGRKDDLVLASTCTPELLRCYLDGSPCASRRFSRVGESFVFVSYAERERAMPARLARRSALESALAAGMVDVGAVTGVGFGVRTSYIDLSLSDLESGLVRLVSILKEADAPSDTFIQFFDSELAEEWLSIWPDSRLTEG